MTPARRRLQRKRDWFQTYKSRLKCEICAESHPACLDFHHRDGEQKVANVAHLVATASFVRLQAEIAKCVVLCANCHRKTHWAARRVETLNN